MANNDYSRYSINKDDLLLIILAVFIPPVPVIIRKGFCNKDTLLNFLLFLILFFPATIHSFYVVYETSKERELEQSNGTTETAAPMNNGDFNVDLESNNNRVTRNKDILPEEESFLPKYDDVAGVSKNSFAKSDNKVQK